MPRLTKLSLYDRWAMVVGSIGYLIVVTCLDGVSFLLFLTPVAAYTGLVTARRYRQDIRSERGWRVIPVSMMIGLANLGLFYLIVAGIAGFGIGLLAFFMVLLVASVPTLAISPVAHLIMRKVDQIDLTGGLHA